MKKAFLAAAALAAALPLHAETVRLNFGPAVLAAEVARTPAEQSRGLMFRTRLAKDSGMVFVLRPVSLACMWMKNTPLPLSVAFIGTDRRIINIEDMKPLTLTRHCAGFPARWAVEAPRGWFAAHGARPGQAVGGLPD